MKSKTLLSIVLIVFVFLTNVKSQQLIIELKTGISSTEFDYHWTERIKSSGKSASSVYNYSIGLSTQVHHSFYLKTQMGTNDIRKRMLIEYASPEDDFFQAVEYTIAGTVSIRQNYIEILPEVRLTKKKWIFLNMGVGLNQIRSSEFLNGSYSVNNNLIFNLADFPKINGNYLSFLLNGGLNLKYKNIGFIFELGLRLTAKTDQTKEIPGIKFKQNKTSFGISYQIN